MTYGQELALSKRAACLSVVSTPAIRPVPAGTLAGRDRPASRARVEEQLVHACYPAPAYPDGSLPSGSLLAGTSLVAGFVAGFPASQLPGLPRLP